MKPALSKRVVHSVLAGLLVGFAVSRGFGQLEVDDPEERVIHYYASDGLADPVARLQQRLAAGEAKLRFESKRGYLRSLLGELHVPVSSQGLVFSKTSSQAEHTSPRTPRAIYFNDQVYVAWVPGGPVIDLAALDPQRGPIFYTLDQRATPSPKLVRRDDCLRCHLGPRTLNVPGLFVRSVLTAKDGRPFSQVEDFVSGHNSPLETRWAGWYVTGTVFGARHLGNAFAIETDFPNPALTIPAEFQQHGRTSAYLSRHSDVVALLVMEHALRMQNLITRANHETRYALHDLAVQPGHTSWPRERIARAGEMLLEYLLFRNETPWHGPIRGSSRFTREFSQLGPRTKQGRSLREFDLNSRLFRYPCSFLIHSPSFAALPSEMMDFLWRRLCEILSGQDQSPTYASLKPEERRAVREILNETQPDFARAEKAWQARSTGQPVDPLHTANPLHR